MRITKIFQIPYFYLIVMKAQSPEKQSHGISKAVHNLIEQVKNRKLC